MHSTTDSLTLVLGGTGKTGRRVAAGLERLGRPVRIGSRRATPPFSWEDRATWAPVLDGAGQVYLAYSPDLAVPGAPATVKAFVELAATLGTRRVVLLSGRGEEAAEETERLVRASGLETTVLRCSWFSQNFSEDYLLDGIVGGELVVPGGTAPEPFVDVDDIAEVAIAALTTDDHVGELYELTGPRLLTFEQAAAEIARANGSPVGYTPVPIDDYAAALAEEGLPDEVVGLLTYLFSEVLDGRNASVADGVQRALGRPAGDFTDYAERAARSAVWQAHTPAGADR